MYSGLMGPMLVCKKGMLGQDGKQVMISVILNLRRVKIVLVGLLHQNFILLLHTCFSLNFFTKIHFPLGELSLLYTAGWSG